MDGFNLWESFTLLKACNYGALIIGLYLFVKLFVGLFKNTLITHYSSETTWKNISMYGSAIASLFLSGNSATAAFHNSFAIETLETAGDKLVDGVPYRDILIAQIQISFRNILILLVLGVIAYFIYNITLKAIKKELEEFRKHVVHKRLDKV